MPIQQDSAAVAVARAHVNAWSNHDFDQARKSLADDAHVTATTTQPSMAAVRAALGPGGAKVTLPAARLYLLDETNRIKAEQVVFFAAT